LGIFGFAIWVFLPILPAGNHLSRLL
jgi:hypothetical protein